MVWPVNPKYAPISPGERDNSQVPPTSGKKPRPTSGIASFVRSVTTRWRAMRGQADAAAHHEAVHERDIRFGIFRDARIHDVFLAPEHLAKIAAGARTLIEPADIAARAQAALARPFQHHHRNRRIGFKLIERRVDADGHFQRHRVERFRPVQPDNASRTFAPDDQVAFGIHHRGRRRHRAPSISLRDTISRMISLVPSRIWCTRRSRTIFSMPYSLR